MITSQIKALPTWTLVNKAESKEVKSYKKRRTLLPAEGRCSSCLKHHNSICSIETRATWKCSGRDKNPQILTWQAAHAWWDTAAAGAHPALLLQQSCIPPLQCSVTASLLRCARHSLAYLGLMQQLQHCLDRVYFPRSPPRRLSVLPSQPPEVRQLVWSPPVEQAIPGSHLSRGEVFATGNWLPKDLVLGWSHYLGHVR